MKRQTLSKLFLFLAVFSVLASAYAAPVKTSIRGNLKGNSIYTEISLRLPVREVSIFSKAPILADGSFTLEFELAEAELFRLFLADNNNMLLVVRPGDRLQLTLDAANLGNNPQANGSAENQAFWDFGRQYAMLSAGVDSVETAWKSLQQAGAGTDKAFETLRGRFAFYDQLRTQAVIEYVRANPASLTGLVYMERLDIDEHFGVYDLYDKALFAVYPENNFVKEFHRKVEAARVLAIGNVAPEISLPDTSGQVKSLSSLRGKVVLIDFWAAWCGPCRKENPHVKEMYKKYNSLGFEVFGVSLDRTAEAWKKAIRDDGLVWTQVSDLLYWKSDAAKLYGVSAIPFTVLIDREGRIIGKKLRGEMLTQKLQEIFGQ
ncbi:MAG TPA: TlpA disulfide reductase family protein [Bacteroidales bacterium]|nr:TlpA disulfide reductase family protein [Bacteroidales bacterium]HSA44226.1 TlpA disulfide reductase family protein [Bacteroidales bacterium]